MLSSDSDDDSDWSTDIDASGVLAADPPAFDSRRLHLRARAIRRAKMLRASPKSRTYFVHLMQGVAGEDNRSFFGRKQSPLCRHASVLRFAARWRALYDALQMEDTLAGHPLAMAFPAQKPGFLEAKGRSSRHRWLVDSGANHHMVTDTTECPGEVTPTSGHITGVDVDVTGQALDLSGLRVFGCPAYVHVDPSRRKKLEPKAWERIFVGYACDSPAYLIYNPATKNVVRSQNVKFNELWLPSHSLSAKNLGENGSDDDTSPPRPPRQFARNFPRTDIQPGIITDDPRQRYKDYTVPYGL